VCGNGLSVEPARTHPAGYRPVVVLYADGRSEKHALIVSEPVRDYRIPLNGRIVTNDGQTVAEHVN